MENHSDKLERLFVMQSSLDDTITKGRKIEFDLSTWVQKQVLAIMSELAEVIDEVNFKWWKNEREIDLPKLKEEVVDLWHFIISLSLKVGMTADEVMDIYVSKNQENINRQKGKSQKGGYQIKEIK